MSQFTDSFDPHLSPGDVGAYLDGVAAPAERARIEAHLSDCRPCRDEVVAVSEAMRRRSTPARWAAAGAAVAAAAAVALLMVPVGRVAPPLSPGAPVLRDEIEGGREAAFSIQVVGPEAAADVPAGAVEFVWRSAGPDALYRLTLATSDGDAVWTTSTGDTALSKPAEIALRPDTEYFWWVDGVLSDGRSTTTGVRRFQVAR